MITDVEDFFLKGCGRCDRFDTHDCSALHWSSGLATLREICRASGASETAKWGHPCYTFESRNIAVIGAFRKDFRISFFNPALMKDPESVLEKAGPNSQHPSMIRFGSEEEVLNRSATLRAYLDEAIANAREGLLAPRSVREIQVPDELIEALDSDPELAEAFDKLTPGRQKSYAINLNSAKKAETRIARIEKFRDKIIAGKGAMER